MLHFHVKMRSATALKCFSLPRIRPYLYLILGRVISESWPHLAICLWHCPVKACWLRSSLILPFCCPECPTLCDKLYGLLISKAWQSGFGEEQSGILHRFLWSNELESAGRGLNYSSPLGKDPECNDRYAGSLPCSTSPLLVKWLPIHKV